MKITYFRKLITAEEGGAKQVNIADVSEILKIINKLFKQGGLDFYPMIRNLEKKRG